MKKQIKKDVKEPRALVKNVVSILKACYTFIVPILVLIVLDLLSMGDTKMVSINIFIATVVFIILNIYPTVKALTDFRSYHKRHDVK